MQPIRRALVLMLPAWALLAVSLRLPELPLDGAVAQLAVRISDSAYVRGSILICLALGALLLWRTQLPWRRFFAELGTHALLLLLFLGGGTLLNENRIKPAIGSPRPDVVFLEEEGALGMSVDEFYAIEEKQARRDELEAVLTDPGFDAIDLRSSVEAHWIHEAGFSLPSGHTYSAMLIGCYFLSMAFAFLAGRRRWPFYALPVWALLVGWSRVLLMVHRPQDILLGGLLGLLVGAAAAWIALRILWRPEAEPAG